MLRIGEFSKIAQVSGRLLRYYDEIGLLKPIHIDGMTGYRFYSAEQLPRLNRILALKDLGMSLEQIRRLLHDAVSADEIRGMLTMRKAQIEQSLQDEIRRLQQVNLRLQQIEKEGTLWEADVVIKEVPAFSILTHRFTNATNDEMTRAFGVMNKLLPAFSATRTQIKHPIFLIHSDLYDEDVWDIEMGYTVKNMDWTVPVLPTPFPMDVRKLPAIRTMASTVHIGWENSLQSYHALGAWIDKYGYQIVGAGRELVLEGDMKNPEKSIWEIQFPVEKMA